MSTALATCAFTSGDYNQPYTCTDPSSTCIYYNSGAEFGCENQATGNLHDACINAGFAESPLPGTLLCPAATPICVTLILKQVSFEGPFTNYECGTVATRLTLLYTATNTGAATSMVGPGETDTTSMQPSSSTGTSSGSGPRSPGAIAGYTIAAIIISALTMAAAYVFGYLNWKQRRSEIRQQQQQSGMEMNVPGSRNVISGPGNIAGRDQN